MTSHDITCAAGGFPDAIPTCLTVVERPSAYRWPVRHLRPAWRWRQQRRAGLPSLPPVIRPASRQSPAQDGTLVVLAATAEGTRHHWRIIPTPERGAVIISRMTGLVLTAGSPDAGGSAPVRLAVYHGAAAQHWSFTDPQGGTDAIQPE
jgi:hypothetical protein